MGTLIVAGLVMAPIAWATTPFLFSKKNRDQRGFLGVVYAPNGPPTIVELWGKGEPEALLDEAVERLQGPNLFHQKRTVSWLTSIPRSCSRSSTLRSDNGNRTYIITAKRMISGLVLK